MLLSLRSVANYQGSETRENAYTSYAEHFPIYGNTTICKVPFGNFQKTILRGSYDGQIISLAVKTTRVINKTF